MKAKITTNMISFPTIRRGEWIMKISVFRNKQVLFVAQHSYELERVIVRYFTDQNEAADFIENLVNEES